MQIRVDDHVCLLDPDLIRYVTELLTETGLPTDLLRLVRVP